MDVCFTTTNLHKNLSLYLQNQKYDSYMKAYTKLI